MSLRAIADGVAIHKNAFADANKFIMTGKNAFADANKFIMTGLLRFARNDKRRLPRSGCAPRNDKGSTGWRCYSSGQADVYSYVPDSSVYCVFAGAYIMHEPDGFDTKQLSAVPADVYPVGQELSAISIYSSFIVT